MLELAVKTLIAYLIGSLMGALLLGSLRGVDIRTQGSGNAGGTNALRTQGKAFALGVIVIDIVKGWFAAAVLPALALPGVGIDPLVDRGWLAVACALAVTMGHVYPVWYEFRGGKGAATLVGVILGLQPVLFPVLFLVWLLIVMVCGYVGLATMVAVGCLPVVLLLRARVAPALLTFSVAAAVLVVYTHRSNIARMWAGNEYRVRRLWLLRPDGAPHR